MPALVFEVAESNRTSQAEGQTQGRSRPKVRSPA